LLVVFIPGVMLATFGLDRRGRLALRNHLAGEWRQLWNRPKADCLREPVSSPTITSSKS